MCSLQVRQIDAPMRGAYHACWKKARLNRWWRAKVKCTCWGGIEQVPLPPTISMLALLRWPFRLSLLFDLPPCAELSNNIESGGGEGIWGRGGDLRVYGWSPREILYFCFPGTVPPSLASSLQNISAGRTLQVPGSRRTDNYRTTTRQLTDNEENTRNV